MPWGYHPGNTSRKVKGLMDTSETYQKMMIGAWPDLKDAMPINALLFSRRLRMLYILDGNVVMWREKVNTSNCERAIPLLEQDQLQEMVGGWVLELLDRFHSFCMWDDQFEELRDKMLPISMERLWLAFVMKQKNKVWDGGKWTTKIRS